MTQPRAKRYAPLAVIIGAVIVMVSIMMKPSVPTGSKTVSDKKTELSDKKELFVPEEAVQVVLDAALTENPALRENMPVLREEVERSLKAQEMMVAEAIERGLASSDAIARNRLSELIMMSIYQEADVGVTPEAVRGYYESHKEKYFYPRARRVQHLFVQVTNVTDAEKARATLEQLFRQAKGAVSKQSESLKHAIAPVWITREELRTRFGPTFEKEVFSLPIGDWSEPIQSTSGWHRVRVLEETPERQRIFDEVQAEVEADLRRKLREDAYNKEIERLSKKYNVKISP